MKFSLNYEDRLKYLRLTPLMRLDTRRNRDLIESYKIINNIYNVNAYIFFSNLIKMERSLKKTIQKK